MRTRSGQSGFTLLELLVVVAVLGALSGVAVVGVNALDDQAQSTVCAADARAIATAQEAALLGGGAYLDEDALVTAGYLREASTLHDITVAGELYSLTLVDACVDLGGAELASAELADDVDEASAKEAAAKQKAAEERKAAEEAAESNDADEKAAAAKAAAEKEAAAKADKEAAEREAAEKKDAEEKKAEQEADESGTSCTEGQVDLNTAPHKDLKTIGHVGGDEATRIIKQRPFTSLDQLTSVKGLSKDDVEDIRKEGRACV